MLLFWILCWSACGIYLVYELVTGNHGDKMQIGLFIFISFWVYFEYRITRVFFGESGVWNSCGLTMKSLVIKDQLADSVKPAGLF